MSRLLRRIGRFLAELVRAQHADQLVLRAAALAYTTLLSLVPVLTILLVTAARVEPGKAEALLRTLAAMLPFSPEQVQETLAAFAQRTAALGWVAVALSSLAAINLFYQIEEVINTVWGVPFRRKLRWRLASFAAVLLWGPLLLTALFSVLYWVSAMPWYPLVAPLGRPMPAVFAIAAFSAVFRWVPHTRVSWRAALTGGAFTTALLVLLHYGFQAYLHAVAEINVIYGSLTLVLFFLISLVLFWLAILLGVETSWVVGHAPFPTTRRQAERLLALLAEIQRDGTIPFDRVARVLGKGGEAHFQRMLDDPPIVESARTGFRLARSADTISLAEVFRRLGPAGVLPSPARRRRPPAPDEPPTNEESAETPAALS